MARPERNNVDYFPYLVDEGEKMYYIDQQYGNDGFATFIKILTSLAKTDYHYLDLSKRTTQMFLSAKCKVTTEILLNIITDLAELGKFNLMLWNENKIIWCQDFIDSIQDAYKKRNNECITFEGLVDLLCGLGIRKQSKSKTTGSVKPQSIVEDIKEEESKEKETKKNKRTIEQFQEIARKSFENCKCEFGNEFKKEWFVLIQTENWRKKDQNAYDYNLKRLMKFDEIFSISLIESAIAGSYKGVVFENTKIIYQKYLNQKNATKSRNHNDLKSERAELRSAALEIIRNS